MDEQVTKLEVSVDDIYGVMTSPWRSSVASAIPSTPDTGRT